jgi:hypothetical protein
VLGRTRFFSRTCDISVASVYDTEEFTCHSSLVRKLRSARNTFLPSFLTSIRQCLLNA